MWMKFKIQNQKRSLEYLAIAVTPFTEPLSDELIQAYYQKNQANYQTLEQVSVDYIELSLNDLAETIKPTEAQLKAFYEEQKDLYTTKERRKISHILFSFGKDGNDEAVLAKAQLAQAQLTSKTFEALAAEVSDDKGTANTGGDLGLFEIGGLEESLEKVASQLKQGEVSAPVKSSFGYHLLKVTELMPVQSKSFEEVKVDVTKAFQRKSAETNFYETVERLTEVSYENTDNLTAAAEAIGKTVQKSALFSKEKGEGIAQEAAIRTIAFSEDVLAGNNSEPIELGTDKVLVLRLSEHQPSRVQPLAAVKQNIIDLLRQEKSLAQANNTAMALKKQLLSGKTLQALATENSLEMKTLVDLTRNNTLLPRQISHAVFKAAKPIDNKPTYLTAAVESGEQYVVVLKTVTEGILTEKDKNQLTIAKYNIAKVLGEATFNAVLDNLQADADIVMQEPLSTLPQ
jgi:peptidyl-prolyl cis-trans isomerase D